MPLPEGVARCGACVKAPPPLDACVAAVDYVFPWAQLITHFKFHAAPGVSHSLALLLRSTTGVDAILETADFVLPVPLSVQRIRERGFNQAALLAKLLARPASDHRAASRCRTDLLLRIKDTPAQSSLDRAHRVANVRGAYAVEPRLAHLLRGKSVLLVDDVMTTGASLHECATTLRTQGAAFVSALILARTL